MASVSGVVAARTQGASKDHVTPKDHVTANDGVYTAEQAVKGKELYGQVCESCHQPSKFSGAEFSRAFGDKPLSEIDAAMAEMPMDNPGSLKREEIASLIAFFLEMNKYPAGQKPLDGEADALKAIMVTPRP